MTNRNIIILGVCSATVALLSGCVEGGYGYVGVGVEAPLPAVEVEVYPDYYWWDGYEYVGIVGGQYYYLGPRHAWIVCEPFRVERFHEWERGHPEWREHATYNEHYRPAGRGSDNDRGRGQSQGKGRGHDRGDER